MSRTDTPNPVETIPTEPDVTPLPADLCEADQETNLEFQSETPFAPQFADDEDTSPRWIKFVLPAAAVVALALIGGWYLLGERTVEVEAVTVGPSRIERTVRGTGQIKPYRPRDVYTPVDGIIATMPIKDGQLVTKGDVLLTLDTDPFEAQLTQAKAALIQAQSARAQAGDGVASQNALISAAYEAINVANAGVNLASNTRAQADADAEYASSYLEWIKAQKAADPAEVAASKQALEAARMMQRESEAALIAAEGQRAAAQAGLAQAQAGDSQAALRAADAAIEVATQQVELAQKALRNTTLKAPANGRVLIAPTAQAAASQSMGGGAPLNGETLQVGAAVAPGMVILTIADPSHTRFAVEIDEAEISEVALDQKAIVTLDGYPDQEFSGVVTKIASATSRGVSGGTVVAVDIVLDKALDDVAFGIKGEVDIIVQSTDAVVVIPQQAVFSEGDTDFVYLIKESTLVRTDVVLGQNANNLFEVTQGLSIGDQVARAGDKELSDGIRVTVAGR